MSHAALDSAKLSAKSPSCDAESLLGRVTPLIITFNEESNIRDTLSRLHWADRIVVVDSYSTDSTLDLASDFPNVDIYQRAFDDFAKQCNFGLSKVSTEWVLSLDADYKCPSSLAHELESLDGLCDGYRTQFQYGVLGKPLRACLYPPRVVLYRPARAKYVADGHAHRVAIDGPIDELETTILHDDWKPFSVWLASQARYAEDEADKLESLPRTEIGWKDRLRTWYIPAPLLTFVYCLFVKGLILDGLPGLYYTCQRVYAELLLSLTRLDRRLRRANHGSSDCKARKAANTC